MTAPAVEIRELSKHFGAFKAVDRVSLSVNTGEIFGFLGANGAGKSTTIRMLCGLLRPTSGTGLVLGIDVAKDPEGVKRRIGYMSQRFSLYDDLTVAQNVRFFGGVYGLRGEAARERQEWALGMAGLLGKEHRLDGRLAGRLEAAPRPGLRRDAPAARGLPRRAHERGRPHLATTLLDADRRDGRRGRDRLRHHALPGRGRVSATALALIHAGRLVALGSVSELKHVFAENAVLEVLAPRAGEALETIAAQPWAIETSVFGTRIHVMVRDEQQGRREIARLLAGERNTASSIERILPSLEDVFIHHVEEAEAAGREART